MHFLQYFFSDAVRTNTLCCLFRNDPIWIRCRLCKRVCVCVCGAVDSSTRRTCGTHVPIFYIDFTSIRLCRPRRRAPRRVVFWKSATSETPSTPGSQPGTIDPWNQPTRERAPNNTTRGGTEGYWPRYYWET
jgi:hypothetical protein